MVFTCLGVIEEAPALIVRFAVGARFRWKFDRQLSSFSLRAKKAHKRVALLFCLLCFLAFALVACFAWFYVCDGRAKDFVQGK